MGRILGAHHMTADSTLLSFIDRKQKNNDIAFFAVDKAYWRFDLEGTSGRC